jgi:hypothetical protein
VNPATWESCLAQALTGSAPTLPAAQSSSDLLQALAALGWTKSAIRDRAQSAWAEGRPWPLPLPEASARFGAARWQAALAELRQELDLSVTVVPPRPRRPLTADERRLLAERPPHYGA